MDATNEHFNTDCPGSLFWEGGLLDLIQEQSRQLCSEVDGYDENFILSSDLEKMADLLVEKYTLKPVQLHHDRTEIVEHGRHLHRPVLLRALALVLIENLFPQAQILWRGFEWSRFSWKDHVLHR